MKIILASISPRRKELLGLLKIPFEVCAPEFLEHSQENFSPEHEALHFARQKAMSLRAQFPDGLIIGSDTIVALGETKLGKPLVPEEAKRMLRLLSGKTHRVLTALAVVDAKTGGVREVLNQAQVKMREMGEREITEYVATGEPLDKAGAYAVQGIGKQFVASVKGDYFTVVGLPLKDLALTLQHFGVKVNVDVDRLSY